jgi:hypothetical protein
MLDESGFTAQNHKDLLVSVLKIFGKSLANVVCLVGDNCATNRSCATLCGIPFVGKLHLLSLIRWVLFLIFVRM